MIIFELLGFIAIIYLLSTVSSLRARVDTLERSNHGASLPGTSSASVVRTVDQLQPVASPAHASVNETRPALAENDIRVTVPRFFAWLREDWLLKLGALLLIIGFGWFVSYAFLNNWIGPMGRITLGLIAGATLLAFGWWRMGRFVTQGSIFLVLGATTVLLTIFAARIAYDFFTPISAMVMMFLVSALVATASVLYRRRTLAIWGIIMAAWVPQLLGPHPVDTVELFYYLFLVTLGTLWIVLITGWRNLVVLALGIITFYSIPQWSYHLNNPLGLDTVTLLGFGFVVVFFVANVFSFFFARNGATRTDIIGALWTSFFLVLWIFSGVAKEWQSLMLALWAVAFVVGSFFLFTQTGNRKPLITYAGIGLILLGIATAVELDGAALVVATTLEAAVATFLSYALLRERKAAVATSCLFIVPAILSLESMVRYPVNGAISSAFGNYVPTHTPIFHEHFFVLLLLAVSFLVLGLFFKRFAKDEVSGGDQVSLQQLHFVLGSLYAYILLWLFAHEAFTQDTASMIALTCYTVAGLVTYLYGRKNDLRAFRIYGGTLLLFVVGRLLLIEVWNMELFGRVITFFLIGTLLMSTAFFGRKK